VERSPDPDVVPLLALRGAPGVGKSAVGRRLVDRRGAGAVVEVDRFRAMLANCDWHDRTQHRVALEAACCAAVAFARSGVAPVVMIDTFGRDGLDRARVALALAGLRLPSITLWATADVLRRRLAARASGYADAEQSLLINDEVLRVRPEDDVLIDTTLGDAEAVVASVDATLATISGAGRPGGGGDVRARVEA
jgi:predicted kinase